MDDSDKKTLGSISPLFGLLSGRGVMGDIGRAGGFGLLGKLVTPKQDDDKEKTKGPVDTAVGTKTGMRRGGRVKKLAKGGALTPAEAVHKHERNMHKGKTPTKFAKGGAAGRGDGIARKGKTKGRFV